MEGVIVITFGELVYRISGGLVFLIIVASSIYGMYAVYYAYFKSKDERQKFIVLQSTAQAFTILLIYFIMDMVVTFARVEQLTWLWQLLHFGIDGVTATGMLSVLGLCLFINKRKTGGD